MWLALDSAMSIMVRLTVGMIADRRDQNHLRVVIVMLVTGAFGYAFLSAATPAGMLAGTILTFGLAWAWIGLFIFAVIRLYPGSTPLVTGMLQTGGLLGAAVGPLLFGALVQHHSYTAAWLAAGGGTLLTAGVIAVADRMAPGPRAPGSLSPQA